jgi:hypothetical protein
MIRRINLTICILLIALCKSASQEKTKTMDADVIEMTNMIKSQIIDNTEMQHNDDENSQPKADGEVLNMHQNLLLKKSKTHDQTKNDKAVECTMSDYGAGICVTNYGPIHDLSGSLTSCKASCASKSQCTYISYSDDESPKCLRFNKSQCSLDTNNHYNTYQKVESKPEEENKKSDYSTMNQRVCNIC